ncbi:YueI family protein [Bacillus sp. PS06]|uniref:YueI family protein n=1 Tax=Bacillus sp. PS06 TaxID=2764176 RepID=UPI001781F858|nr:YueI family protein [Bacillus sp. PS06]MBD8068482.1 YueI family protein [Bacillus sp. PS06]
MAENIDDYLERGIYGVKEIKSDERQMFLSTIRERVILALTDGQVMKSTVYEPIKKLIKQYPDCQMLLDGDISYSYLSKYVKLANTLNVPFTIVDDVQNKTNIGLVLASKNAINREDIYVSKDQF